MPRPEQSAGANPGSSSDSLERASQFLCDAYRIYRIENHGLLVESFLADRDIAGLSDEQMLDLLYNEYLLRIHEGERPQAGEYRERFPQYGAHLERLIAVDRAFEDAPVETILEGVPAKSGVHAPEISAIGKYRVIAELGKGGQAVVYRGHHPDLNRDVVIKWSLASFDADPTIRQRFHSEGRILASLDHPNLARVYDIDILEDRPYLVMEYVPGTTLAEYSRLNALSSRQIADLVETAARAVGAAHQMGIIHRDLKPDNILITPDEQLKVIDFGLALPRQDDQPVEADFEVCGTLQYMAPEQAGGELIDPRSDVFSLGGVLFFLLTGSPPIPGTGAADVFANARSGLIDVQTFRTCRAARTLRKICLRALHAERDQRFADGNDLAKALHRYRGQRTLIGGAAVLSVAALSVAVLLAVLFVWPGLLSSWKHSGPVTPSLQRDDLPSVSMRVWRDDRYIELADAVPLHTGNELEVRVDCPSPMNLVMYLLTSDGKLRKLAERQAKTSNNETFRYPANANQSVVLSGSPGTECVFVCGSRDRMPKLDGMLTEWNKVLPVLPPSSILRLLTDRVEVEQHARDFGPFKMRRNPELECLQEVEALRIKIRSECSYCEGLVFAHVK